jgi:hypothetical protein
MCLSDSLVHAFKLTSHAMEHRTSGHTASVVRTLMQPYHTVALPMPAYPLSLELCSRQVLHPDLSHARSMVPAFGGMLVVDAACGEREYSPTG